MKLNSTTLLLPVLSFAAQLTEASVARVYTSDPNTARQITRELSPETARLVLAQRAGVEAYHDLTSHNVDAIAAINDFGRRQQLFAAGDDAQRALILLEGAEEFESSLSALEQYTSFHISDAPPSRGLFLDLAKQADPKIFAHVSDDDAAVRLRDSKTLTSNGQLFYLAQSMSDFQNLFDRLVRENWSVTAIVTPGVEDMSIPSTPYGSYSMPAHHARSLLQRSVEEPLELPPIAFSSYKHDSADSAAVSLNPLAANNTPLRGILPSCFRTLAACQSTTRNCTGHGECTLKYTDANAADPPGGACYACACSATKSNNGHKTTNWGGPACQKKDVVAPFWLLAGFSVALVFLVTFGIGTLYSMGDEDLPSVIGAGVSGPARK